jgi:hypothetical protein
MGLIALSPSSNPVTLAQVKQHLRIVNDIAASGSIPASSSDDPTLTVYLEAALEYAETQTRQQFCERQWQLTRVAFPGRHRHSDYAFNDGVTDWFPVHNLHDDDLREIKLPKPPLISVQSVQYIDPSGNNQTLSPTAYTVDNTVRPGRIVLNPGQCWPITGHYANAVTIAFTAGYSDTVPMILQELIQLLVGHYYENREGAIDRTISVVPMAVQSIINQEMYPEIVG